jgi:Tol biopolymer transport system component
MFRRLNFNSLAAFTAFTFILGCGGAHKNISTQPESTSAPAEPVLTTGEVSAILSGPTQLTFDSSNSGLGYYSPDGKSIVYQSDRDGKWQIYMLNLADSSKTHLVSSNYNDENPVWTADRNHVLFVSDRTSQGKEWARDVFSYNPADSATSQLTSDPSDDWYPVPLDAGSFLFLSERGATDNIPVERPRYGLYLGYLDGRPPLKVAGQDFDLSAPADLGDGNYLIRTFEGRLEKLIAANGSTEILTPSSLHVGTVSFNKGRRAAVLNAREADSYQLYLLDLDRKIIQKVDTGEGEVRFPQFSMDGMKVLYSKEVHGEFQLFQLELAQ